MNSVKWGFVLSNSLEFIILFYISISLAFAIVSVANNGPQAIIAGGVFIWLFVMIEKIANYATKRFDRPIQD